MKKVLICSRVSMFPPEHGGAKNLRSIARALAKEGVECRVLVKMHPEVPERRRFGGQHRKDIEAQAQSLQWVHEGVAYRGIEGDSQAFATSVRNEIKSFHPDAVVMCDDSLDEARELFEAGAESERLVFFAQTIHCLPFGPYSMRPSEQMASLIAKGKKIVVPSRYVQSYVEKYLGRSAWVHYPDVFGDFPFPMLGRLENPYVTMINPCPWKGSSIFKALAKRRPDVRFAAVPTWGATPALMEELKTFSNVTLLKESTDIDEIFSVTKVLLAPSLCQEAFGLVSPEAMLRGIPVIASDIAALKESTLSAARLIPVNPLPFDRPPQGTDPSTFVWKEPENAVEPWCKALDQLLNDAAEYEKDSLGGKKAAEEFVRSLSDRSIVELLTWP